MLAKLTSAPRLMVKATKTFFSHKLSKKYTQNIERFSKFSFQRKLYFRLNFWNSGCLHGFDLM